MIPIKVATASLNQTPLDWAGNQRRIEAVLDEARACDVGLLVLPELCTTGYGLSLIHISEPTRPFTLSRMPSSA